LRRKLAEATDKDLALELEITLDQRRERRAGQGDS